MQSFESKDVKSSDLDDKLSTRVVPLTSPNNLFFKTSDIYQKLPKIRFIVYTSGAYRVWIWGWYDISSKEFIVDNKCRYGKPGAKLIDLDKSSYKQGFIDMANTVKNRIVEVAESMISNPSPSVYQFYQLLSYRRPTREDVDRLTAMKDQSYELDPHTPFFLNVILSNMLKATILDFYYIRSQLPDLFLLVCKMDPMLHYKHESASDRHRSYTYYLAILDGIIKETDLKPDVISSIVKQLLVDTSEISPTYIEFMRYWIIYYRDNINLVSLTYSDMKLLNTTQQDIVREMVSKFGEWTRDGKIYREDPLVEPCPTEDACEILDMEIPGDPLCAPWSFGKATDMDKLQ